MAYYSGINSTGLVKEIRTGTVTRSGLAVTVTEGLLLASSSLVDSSQGAVSLAVESSIGTDVNAANIALLASSSNNNNNSKNQGTLRKMRSQDNIIQVAQNVPLSMTNTNDSQQQQSQSQTNNNSGCTQSANWNKIQALKQRKSELERKLNEKNKKLQEIQKQEAQILGNDCSLEVNSNTNDDDKNSTLRRKIGASFKFTKNVQNNKEQAEIENLLLEKRKQQDISNTAYGLFNDLSISTSNRRIHKNEFDVAQQKIVSINQNLGLLKKRQTQHSKGHLLSTSSTGSGTSTATSGQIQHSANNAINLTLTKSSSGRQTPDYMKTTKQSATILNDNINNNLLSSKKYGSNNSVNNYFITERRTSTKSMSRSSPKLVDDNTIPLDRSSTGHRSDYELNRLLSSSNTNTVHDSRVMMDTISCNEYLYKNILQSQQNEDVENLDPHYQHHTHLHQHHNQDTIERNHHNNNINCGNVVSSNPNISQNSNSNIKYGTNKGMQGMSGTISGIDYTNSNEKNLYVNQQLSYDETAFMKTAKQYFALPIRQSFNVAPGMTEEQLRYSIACEKNNYHPGSSSSTINSRRYNYENTDAISISPSVAASLHDQQQQFQHHQQAGLGGYWKILSNNERVWCIVDSSYDSSTLQHTKNNKMHLQQGKSTSLGNFDTITTKDEMIDKISLSSVNSETNKKQKEKQWLETSLDGPIIKTKQTTLSDNINIRTFPFYGYNVSSVNTVSNYQTPNQTLVYHHHSPNYNTYSGIQTIGGGSGNVSHHPVHKQSEHRERSKLSSQSMSNNNYRPQTIPKLENQLHLSQSTSILNNDAYKNVQQQQQHHLHQQQQLSHQHQTEQLNYQISSGGLGSPGQHKQQLQPATMWGTMPKTDHSGNISTISTNNKNQLSPVKSTTNIEADSNLAIYVNCNNTSGNINNNFHSLKNSRSPAIGYISKAPDIRIESPKNMTVVQQAIFVPYKEVTKPFEMSDFYKYSTKFRQKDHKSQQILNPSTDVEGSEVD